MAGASPFLPATYPESPSLVAASGCLGRSLSDSINGRGFLKPQLRSLGTIKRNTSSPPLKLQHIALEGFSVPFVDADSDLIEEMQLLLRNAGCIIPEIDGLWSAQIAAALAVFCAVNEMSACGVTPQLAAELLEYREQLHG